jgi:type IV pilus biogenesis protein CpaD/CtpE
MTNDQIILIKATNIYTNVFLDKHDESVWLSIQLPNGSANCTLSIEAAKEMIAALTRIVEASE